MRDHDGLQADTERSQQAAADLIDEVLGYLFSAALRTAAALGVADHLADRPRTCAELAALTGADAQGLHRVLRLLATRGLFEEDTSGRFRLTAAGDPLRSAAPFSVRAAVLMLTDQTMWRPAGEMTRCLTEDTPVFESIFGVPFFAHFARSPEVAALFHDGMAAMSNGENQPIADSYDFPPAAKVVDVGGGHGGLLAAVLNRHPTLHGVLFDQAHVLAGHRLGTQAPAGRWEVAEGDFFTQVPAGDIYLIKRILHDWADAKCVTVLSRCRRAMAPDGRVLIIDAVIPPGNDPHQAKTLDLMMMASLGGRERGESEFAHLLEASGLRLNRIIATPTVLSIVEAVADAVL